MRHLNSFWCCDIMRQCFCYVLSTPEQFWEKNILVKDILYKNLQKKRIPVKDQAAALREIKKRQIRKRPRLTCQAVRQEVHIRCPQGSIFTSLSFSAQILHSWNVEPISQYSSYCSWGKTSINHSINTKISPSFYVLDESVNLWKKWNSNYAIIFI